MADLSVSYLGDDDEEDSSSSTESISSDAASPDGLSVNFLSTENDLLFEAQESLNKNLLKF